MSGHWPPQPTAAPEPNESHDYRHLSALYQHVPDCHHWTNIDGQCRLPRDHQVHQPTAGQP